MPELDDPTLTDEQREAYGILDRAPQALQVVDRREGWAPAIDAQGRLLEQDDTCFRETGDGIEVWRHPQALLLEYREAWGVWALFQAGVRWPLSMAECNALSALELEQLAVLHAARARCVVARSLREQEQRERESRG